MCLAAGQPAAAPTLLHSSRRRQLCRSGCLPILQIGSSWPQPNSIGHILSEKEERAHFAAW